jgi:hypothetical protein
MRLSVMTMTDPSQLDNHELVAALSRLARSEREASVALLIHLAEFDDRRLYEGAGYSSTFRYCMAVLHMSEDAIFNRIEAARALKRFPRIVDMLRAGSVSLTTVRLLNRRLTPENHADLLAAAAGMGKREVEDMLAHRFPEPDVTASVRKLPVRSAEKAPATPLLSSGASPEVAVPVATPTATPDVGARPPSPAPSVNSATPARPAVVRPLAPARYEIRFTASEETRDRLRRAQDLLSHAIPTGDIALVVDRALVLLIKDLERRKFAATDRPREGRMASGDSDHIPAAVRREVMARDGGQCRFVAADGHRCGETRLLQFHHAIPRAVGGPTTAANLELRCRAHNGYEVDRCFGSGVRRGKGGVRLERATFAPGERTRPGTSRPSPT